MNYQEILKYLKSKSDSKNVAGMARFGISSNNTLGIPVPVLRDLAKKTGKNHDLAKKLWASKIHEARLLASMVDDKNLVTEKQMDSWVKDFDSWDVCDQTCMNLFETTPFAFKKAVEWTKSDREFVKRSGFAMMACIAWKNKTAKDKDFLKFFPIIKKYSKDERNYVRKAVNWALRQIGKRNKALNRKALKLAKEIQKINSKTAKWIANDAIRELESEAVQKRLK